MKNLLLLLSLFVCSSLSSQTPKYRVVSIPVERNGTALREPWVGGLNSPQFSAINLNGDSLPDLFIYDKVGDKVLTYINNGNGTDSTYTYAPQYEGLFPQDLFSWALIRDYNNDNIPDIFAHAGTGTKVYKGSYQGGQLRFDIVSELLKFPLGNFESNIWTYIDDIPVFADVNRDGDMDILAYPLGFNTVEYFENQTMENIGNPAYHVDSFKYERYETCWGNFVQGAFDNSFVLNISCRGGEMPTASEGQRHTGNSLYSFDHGNDHDIDLLNGNIGYENLAFLENCGDSSYANVCQWDSLFPICNQSALMPTFPAAFGLDVNGDGFEDLLVSPNVRSGGRDVRNVMLYKGNSNPSCPFEYQGDTFLVQHMLDFGTDSKPVFVDFNGDGLLDIVVGNYGYFRPFQVYKSTLAFFQNEGTASQPRYRQLTDDYNSFSNYSLVSLHPAFGDLDGDGKADMVLGELNGELHFFKNTGATNASYPTMTTPRYFNIDIGQFSTPFIYDVNNDGLNDLVVGRKDGKLSYFWNFGSPTVAQFSTDSVNSNFGAININVPGYDGNSVPFINKDTAGNMKLYVASFQGTVFMYDVDIAKLRGGSFQLVDSNFIGYDVGSKATLSIADINNDGKMEYLVGNSRGGILMYSDSMWDTSTVLSLQPVESASGSLHLYPNPTRDYLVCELSSNELSQPAVEIYNMLGERIAVQYSVYQQQLKVNTNHLARGLYFIRITHQATTYTGKFVIEK